MTRIYLYVVIAMVLVIIQVSCSQKESHADYAYEKAEDSSAPASDSFLSSSAAVEKKGDTLRKFIRTADIKCKVKDVVKATYKIEDITTRLGGFVTYTHLTSTIDHHTTTKISADSSLESTAFTIVNSITLRVPNTQLDSTLKAIAPLVEHLDYRTIRANDIGLQIFSNRLAEARTKKYEKRLSDAIDRKGNRLEETSNAEENMFYKQEAADNAKISNLSLMDQASYSTVNLSLYQRQAVRQELVANIRTIDSYEAGFGQKLLESLKEGWKILEAFILFLAQFWGLVLFAAVVYILFRKYGYRLKKQ